MCLTTKDPKVRTAEKDIEVYKHLSQQTYRHKQKGFMRLFRKYKLVSTLVSTARGFQYGVGISKPKVNLNPLKLYNTWVIEEGYHSDVNLDLDRSNAIFIIPKGASYIEGWYNDDMSRRNYVSDTIIFKEMIKP